MSGSNIARKIQRSMVRAGKMTPKAYKALRRKIDVEAIDDAVNAPIRRLAWALSKAGMPTDHLRLREIIYHPTKGFRSFRGAEVEAENLGRAAA